MVACVAEDGSPGGEETSRVSSHSNNRLPAELLVEIATCIQDELSDLQGPTVMSQVCGSWRVAVVDAANLWKTITVVGRNTALLQRYMQRSKDVPVDVTVTKAKLSDLDVAAMSEIIADHAHHIHSLCIDDSLEMSGVGRYIMSGLTSPMPMLETLCCYSRVPPVLETLPPTLLLEALPFHPSLNQFPRLQFISLRGLFVPWTSLRMFSHLRTLELQCSIARPASSTADFSICWTLVPSWSYSPWITLLPTTAGLLHKDKSRQRFRRSPSRTQHATSQTCSHIFCFLHMPVSISQSTTH